MDIKLSYKYEPSEDIKPLAKALFSLLQGVVKVSFAEDGTLSSNCQNFDNPTPGDFDFFETINRVGFYFDEGSAVCLQGNTLEPLAELMIHKPSPFQHSEKTREAFENFREIMESKKLSPKPL